MNVTLVACYGAKGRVFAEFIAKVQGQLTLLLGDDFEPYELNQVHGTIIGLEGDRGDGGILNRNFRELQQRLLPMDLAQVVFLIQEPRWLPLDIRVGGYKANLEYPFASRGLHPFFRSFSIHGDSAVLMGWPVDDGSFPPTLDRLRRMLSKANVLHKYHVSDEDTDNDFYCVLGRIMPDRTTQSVLDDVQDRLRLFIAGLGPLILRLRREDLALVAYSDSNLPPRECRVYSLEDALRRVNEIEGLYDRLV